MQKLPIFRDGSLSQLFEDINGNLPKYKQNETWVPGLLDGQAWNVLSKIDDLADDLLLLPDNSAHYDLENSQHLYEAMHGLTLTQATDPRLWAYLTHVKFWAYMRKRWPIERSGDNANRVHGTIAQRYFLPGDRSRGVTRNGIARLWWAGYTCYIQNDNPADAMALAGPLFSKQDVFASFMERAFSKNREFMQAILRPLQKRYAAGHPFDEREDVRGLAKHLVMTGGVTILDGIDSSKVEAMVEAYIQRKGQSEELPTN